MSEGENDSRLRWLNIIDIPKSKDVLQNSIEEKNIKGKRQVDKCKIFLN